MKSMSRGLATLAVTVTAVVLAGGAYAKFSPWTAAQKIDEIGGNSPELNTASVDGCPIQSPDGLSLYMASARPGGKGGLDIWVATRSGAEEPWGPPVNLGEPVNSAADDFCPTPIRGGGLFFVSREVLPGVCGQGDIYFTRHHPGYGWHEPHRLACAFAGGPNSELDEQGPSYVEVNGQEFLYFSRSSMTPSVAGDIFMSERLAGDGFGPATAVTALNDAAANDIQPNVSNDGLKVVFSSDRAGGAGLQDIWVATRKTVNHPWASPINLGAAVNTSASETRPSLSRRADQLLFGRSPGPEGMSDIYVTTRENLKNDDD